MRKLFIIGTALAAAAIASPAQAASERTLTGAAIGAGAGAVVLGPVGAVAGGAIGAWVGGPKVSRNKHCWWDRHGYRHCTWR